MLNNTLIMEWIEVCGNESLCLDFVNKLKDMNMSSILDLQTILNSSIHHTGMTELEVFHRRFTEFHGTTGLVVCVIGVIVSIVTLSILCKRKLRTSTNLLLSAMAVSDMLTMLFYIPLLLTVYILDVAPSDMNMDLMWKTFYLFSILITATCHTYSVWVGVTLSVIRLYQVRQSAKYPTNQNKWMKIAKVGSLISFFVTAFSLSPFYYQISFQAFSDVNTPEMLDFEQESSYSPVLFYAVLSKVIPAILMIISGIYIVLKTTQGETKRRRSFLGKGKQKGLATTRILLLLITLFVISELPQGIMMILGICWPEYFSDIYHLTGDLQDFVAIVVSSINFILYCIMSKRFRSEFVNVYLRCCS